MKNVITKVQNQYQINLLGLGENWLKVWAVDQDEAVSKVQQLGVHVHSAFPTRKVKVTKSLIY